ncbi:MAG: hypothetical protein LIO93_08575 [Bacteroidales bacterium]|nr:hypothetical protein [Bacteroidales bacterium]
MKKVIINTFIVLMASVLGVSIVQAQVRIALKNNAYVIKGEKYAALEIDGKVVVPDTKHYLDFTTSTGKYFVAEFFDGNFRLFDRNGQGIPLGGVHYFYKLSIVDGTIVAQIGEDSPPKYYSESNPSVEIQVQKADPNHFEKELERKGGFSPQLAGQRKDIEIMKKALAEVEPIGWFELRENDNKGIDLVVDGKVLFNARSFTLISDAEEYKKSNCWFFIVTRGDFTQRYGVYGISMYIKEGKKEVENVMTIPYEYTFISHEGGNMVKCSKNTGSSYFNWFGWNFDRDWHTGKYTSTYKKWIYDKSIDKWTLQKQEQKK